MKKNYAVVDIETTGTDPKTDRIIQFGCVLIENGKIVTHFSTDINPDQNIPAQIQTLTGITNQRTRKAPYFEDVAQTITNLLEDTIFVAHNIHFDYPFLSNELERCGMPPLTIPGIDTVELAQVFMPTSLSFRLKDLAEELHLVHENPHQADSDADVTAQLLLYLDSKIKELPIITVEKIVETADQMAFQTKNYLEECLKEMQEAPRPLSDELVIIRGLALRKKRVPLFSESYFGVKAYPRSRKAKEKIYHGELDFRKEQARLMNLVYDFFNKKDDKNILVEAATGIGKTLGYLLPMSFLATPEKPLVISTVSLLLQEQILSHDLPLINRLLDQPLQAVVMKSSRHYLDLERFYQSFEKETAQKQYTFYQMSVLVWLTQTETGDFDELNMTSLKHPFWQEVSHLGVHTLNPSSPFYQADFIHHRQKKLAQSNLVITNHAYLAQEDQRKIPQLPNSSYLIIDEAHHLNRVLEKVSTQNFNVLAIQRSFAHLFDQQTFAIWKKLIHKDKQSQHTLEILQDVLQELNEDLTDFYRIFKEEFPAEEERLLTKEMIDQLSLAGEHVLQRIKRLYQDALDLGDQLSGYFVRYKETFSIKEQAEWGDLQALLDNLTEQQTAFETFSEKWDARYVHWFNAKRKTFQVQDLEAALISQTKWYERYKQILYLGGTLKIGSDRHYFAKRWGIAETPLKIISSPYDYANQARLYLPTDTISIQSTSPDQYAQYIADVVRKMAGDQKRPILVLFTSHDILNRVYQRVRVPLLNEGREVLAQGVGGSREKLLKRFLLSNDALLFGADSFWEGVDLPGEILQLLIVTRLPFENPKRLQVKARNEYLASEGINPFYQEAVPHAALRLRQALGRLIRSDKDKGVMLLLDQRFITAKYGEKLRKALPKDLPIKQLPLEEILLEADQFLNSDKSDEN
ncbi:helicase C-terminal domain-containing protein [Enterococcus gilvus]|uniref:helicase C-terminal domain-containing protein n=1 Tax=Enterococcus gilvus TaxID=160453 RepID=UPI002912160B|nr:helicase C-terminal domain-containing protein [Enterococcus gilvus]MDU5508929.1 helicase C-terminal domain-containing protein [Enterococcus gilvus]